MIKIIVNDMTCMHCFQAIQKSLIKEGIIGQIDLSSKTIKVKEEDYEKAIKAIENSGYTPSR